MVKCVLKEPSTAVQWNGSNIREMRDFLTPRYESLINSMTEGTYAVKETIYSSPMLISENEFNERYKIVTE